MKPETILNALNFLDDEILAETGRLRCAPCTADRKRRWMKWGAAAACLLAALWTLSIVWPITRPAPAPSPDSSQEAPDPAPAPDAELPEASEAPPDTGLPEFADPTPDAELPELPKLTVSDIGGDDMGFAGLMAFDVSELTNANPWTEDAALSTLPVYRNHMRYEENYYPIDVDWEQMEALFLETAGKLGMDTENLRVTKESGWSNYLVGGEDGIVITVWSSMEIQIDFEPVVSLPEPYHFTYYSTYEELEQTAGYLLDTYKDLIAMEDPRLNVNGGDYDIYLRQSYDLEFFETGENLTEDIINYNFYPVQFSSDSAGGLMILRIFRTDLSEKMGDYPIITPKEALDLLENGSYITSVPYDVTDMELVKKTELVYETSDYETYFLPYYQFYVELPEEEKENGMKTYGLYYVPAVNGRYLEVLPPSRGVFN